MKTLDHSLEKPNNEIEIHNVIENNFTPALRFFGFVWLALGLFNLVFYLNILAFIISVIIGGAIVFSKKGIILQPKIRQFKSYISYWFIKTGDWETFENFPYIAILKRNLSTTAFSRAHVEMTTSSDTFYDIFLLSPNHRKKVLVQRSKDIETAKTEAQKIAEKLGVEYTTYSPAVSAQTQARRARRR